MSRGYPPDTTPPGCSGRSNAPDYTEGFLRVPLSVWYGLFCRAGGPHPLTRRQLQIVAVVLRETWGWGAPGGGVRPWTRPMTPAQFARSTGLSTDRLARDLRALVGRGVLLEEGGRYQAVPYPQAWLPPAAEGRTPPPERTGGAAETTSLRGDDRKRKDNSKKRSPEAPSGAGDNPGPDLPGRSGPPAGPGREERDPLEKLRRLVASVAGPLAPAEDDALRSWVGRVGVAGVWREVEPALLRGRVAARQHLIGRLRTMADSPEGQSPGETGDRGAGA